MTTLAPDRPALTAGRPDAEPTALLHRPLASYYLVLGTTGLLLILGLVMVFSASSVSSYSKFNTPYYFARNQAMYIGLGLPIMWVSSRIPIRVWRKLGGPLLLLAVVLLVAVLLPGVGKRVDGATRWIALPGGFNMQPSELAKLALALWGADLLVRKQKLLGERRHLFIPLVPVAVLLLFLIMLEPDMGTSLATVSVLVALLWVVGTPLRYFGVFLAALVSMAAMLAVAEPYRLQRLTSFINPCDDSQKLDAGFQACQGLYALSSGGWFGRGLGASREKWSGGLPNAHTDFVFAIIGEELGLIGSLAVLVLFATLTYAGIRIAKRAADPFARLAASGVTAWLAVQATINIGAVVGLVPITGIPLPFLSFGGSALLPTLVAIGMLLAFARAEPGAQEALDARPVGGPGVVVSTMVSTVGTSRADSGPARLAGRLLARAGGARDTSPVASRRRPPGQR